MMQNNNGNDEACRASNDALLTDVNSTQKDSKKIQNSISVSAAGQASNEDDMALPCSTSNKNFNINSTSSPPVPAPRRNNERGRPPTAVNGKSSSQCFLTHQRSLDLHGDAVSLATDNLSVASKTSRSSRFLRGVSFRRSRAATWLAAKLRKHQKSSDLSAAFNLLDQENKGVLVDLNSATEEELMTVEGISRAVARSIVEYRAAIGGFRSLQDLALVSGVGAARLAALCRDLTLQCSDDQSQQSPPSLASRPPSIVSAPTPSPHSAKPLPPPHPVSSSQPSSQYSSSPRSSLATSHISTPVHPSLSACASTPLTSSPAITTFPLRRVNLNTASIFELMTVPGVNQEMAANIVHYRDRKGPFKTVDEVTRVRGMRAKLTRHLHPHLTVTSNGSSENGGSSSARLATAQSSIGLGGEAGNGSFSGDCDSPSRSPCDQDRTQPPTVASRAIFRSRHRRTLSAPLQNNGIASKLGTPDLRIELTEENAEDLLFQTALSNETGAHPKSLDSPVKSSHRLSIEFSSDVYELLSLRSERPEINGLFENSHNGRSAVRLATWNLSQLTPDKISNPGVMEVVCRTVLERGISVLAVQDLLAPNLLEKICTELNSGSLRRVREWPGKKGSWAFVQSRSPVASYTLCSRTRIACNEYVGFLFNKRYVELVEDSVLDCGSKHHCFASQPHIARFKTGHLTFIMANLHVKYQSFIYRSESFLQNFGGEPNNNGCSSADDHTATADTFSCGSLEADAEPSSPDALKSNKNLQNGLIKEKNSLGRDELSRVGGGVTTTSSSMGARRRLDLNSTHLTNGAGDSSLEDELRAVLARVQLDNAQENIVILGDFGVAPDSDGVSNLLEGGYTSVLEEGVSTVLSGSGVSPSPPQSGDNIWLGPPLLSAYTGSRCCVKDGLSHLAIPRGWGWGGLATPHCPVYADLYTDEAR